MRPYDRYETAEAGMYTHEAGSVELSGTMTIWDQLDLSMYCSGKDLYNAQLCARAKCIHDNEAASTAAVCARINAAQVARRASLGPIVEPRQLGRKL